jgi:isopentenyldiphosphate isomerase
VEALFDNNPDDVFHTLTVFIFSREGKLLLQKTAEIPKP